MLKILDKIVYIVSLIAAFGLIGAYLSPIINPNTFVFFSLLGLAYPYLLIGNFILLLYWIFRWKRRTWQIVVVIAIGYPTFRTYYGTAKTETGDASYDLSLLSYNIRYFDVYGWSNQKNTREKLFNYLNKFDGDVICLQEFLMNGNPDRRKTVIEQSHTYPYYYIEKDMAIFSRLPILHKGHLTFAPGYSSSCIYGDFKLGKDTVRLYSVHLESYKLGKKERQFMKEISSGLKGNDIPEGVKNLTTRLMIANKNRAHQAEEIQRHIDGSPYPVILCGDFNDTPLSYTYRQLSRKLTDSFIEKGRGIGNTYIGEFPSFRIDYVLHSPTLYTVGYIREDITLSDHYPIKVKIRKGS